MICPNCTCELEAGKAYLQLYFCPGCNKYYGWRVETIRVDGGRFYADSFERKWFLVEVPPDKSMITKPAPYCLVSWYPQESKIVPDRGFLAYLEEVKATIPK